MGASRVSLARARPFLRPFISSNAAPFVRLFQNKVMFLLKIIQIYDEPLLSGQPS